MGEGRRATERSYSSSVDVSADQLKTFYSSVTLTANIMSEPSALFINTSGSYAESSAEPQEEIHCSEADLKMAELQRISTLQPSLLQPQIKLHRTEELEG